jgi:two-component system LytT family response regulator
MFRELRAGGVRSVRVRGEAGRWRGRLPFPNVIGSYRIASMKRLGVLVVEHEPRARERLARLVAEHDDFTVVAACGSCDETMQRIALGAVDVALLDFQMPGITGLDFSAQLNARGDSNPIVVFVSAHKRFAFEAFKLRAADFLLKPFDPARLLQALDVARERFNARQAMVLAQQIHSVVDKSPAGDATQQRLAPAGRFVVRDNGRYLIVRHDQIDWIQADGRDCILHCAGKQRRIDGPLTQLAARLCSDQFVQVSRSSLINIDNIAQLQEMFKGDLVAVTKDGQEVRVSRRFRTQVMDRLAR